MIVAKIHVNNAIAHTVYKKVIPAGIIGAQVEFEYADDVWSGLHKTVVFRGPVTKDVVTDASIITIPPEVVEKPLYPLRVGVYGVDADGNLAIPTIWADLGIVRESAYPSGDSTTDPSLPVWAQIKQIADEAKQQALSVRNDADSGAFDGAPGAPGHTPEYGVDYGTPEQIAGISQSAAEILQPNISQLKSDIAAVSAVCGTLENTEGGTVIHLTDCADRPLKGLRIFGRTVQDGTPTPEAPVELVSVGDSGSVSVTVFGKNFVDLQHSLKERNSIGYDVTITKTANSVIISGSNPNTWASVSYYYYLPAGTYTYSANMETDIGYMNLSLYVSNSIERGFTYKTALQSSGYITFALDKPMYADVRCHFTGDSGTNGETWTTRYYDIQIEKGSIATGFEPGNNQILTIPTPNGLPGIPVTYGGNYTDADGQRWICDEIDFSRGVYVQRVCVMPIEPIDINSLQSINSYGIANFAISLSKRALDSNISKFSAKCNRFVAQSSLIANTTEEGFMIASASTAYIRIKSEKCSTLSGMREYISNNPIQIAYILETPVESTLDAEILAAYAALHTYKPNTTIYNDADAQIEVGYQADTKLYIDKQFAELRNAIVSLGGNV